MTAGAILALIKSLGGGSGGGGLPSVTAVDNGKVLTVEEGSWAAANPSGGGGMVVQAVMGSGTLTLDKTWKEIHDAIQTVPVSMWYDDTGSVCPVLINRVEHGDNYFVDALFIFSDGGVDFQTISFTTDSENGYPSASMGG